VEYFPRLLDTITSLVMDGLIQEGRHA